MEQIEALRGEGGLEGQKQVYHHVDDKLGFSDIISIYILPFNACKYFVQVGLSTTVQLLDHLPRAEKKGWWTMIHIETGIRTTHNTIYHNRSDMGLKIICWSFHLKSPFCGD